MARKPVNKILPDIIKYIPHFEKSEEGINRGNQAHTKV